MRRIFVYVWLAAAACGPVQAQDPAIVVEPHTAILFSRVIVGHSETQDVLVRNVGRATLEYEPSFAGAATPFTVIVGDGHNLNIEPGGSRTITVVYTPTAGAVTEDLLVIASNDPRRPSVSIPVRAAFAGPHLRIDPPVVDFGLVQGRAGPIPATVVNDGTEDLTVTDTVLISGTDFTLADPGFTAGTLMHPGDSYPISVAYVGGAGAGSGRVEARPSQGAAAKLILDAPPTAIVAADLNVQPLQQVTLDGSPSRAPGNTVTGYAWTITEAPIGSNTASAFTAGDAQIVRGMTRCPAAQNDVPKPCFFPDVPGIYRFSLVVRDDRPICPLRSAGEACTGDADCCGFTCAGTCTAPGAADGVCAAAPMTGCTITSTNLAVQTVRAIPDQAIFVSLTWDGDGDMDLHLVRDSGAARAWTHAPDDVYWNDPQPDWGVADPTDGSTCTTSGDCTAAPFLTCKHPVGMGNGTCFDTTDDPRLLIDVTDAFGPEETGMKLPPADTYHIGVHYYPDEHMTPRRATVRVFVLGVEQWPPGFGPGSPMSAILTRNQFWYVGRIVVPADLAMSTIEAEPFVVGANPSSNAEPGNYPPIP